MHSVLRGRLLALTSARVLLFSLARLPFVSAAPHLAGIESFRAVEDGKSTSDPSLWLYLGIAAALVLTGGAFAGLTIALMGQVSLLPSYVRHVPEMVIECSLSTVSM